MDREKYAWCSCMRALSLQILTTLSCGLGRVPLLGGVNWNSLTQGGTTHLAHALSPSLFSPSLTPRVRLQPKDRPSIRIQPRNPRNKEPSTERPDSRLVLLIIRPQTRNVFLYAARASHLKVCLLLAAAAFYLRICHSASSSGGDQPHSHT